MMERFLEWVSRRECIRRRVKRSIPVYITCDGLLMMGGTVEELCCVSVSNGFGECVKMELGRAAA